MSRATRVGPEMDYGRAFKGCPFRVHIALSFREGPWGGGNQFLKSLRRYLQDQGRYAEHPAEADVFLHNSFQDVWLVAQLRRRYPGALFVHRLAGPMSVHNPGDKRDVLARMANRWLADATIYQSEWSREQFTKLWGRASQPNVTIPNAPHPTLFNTDKRHSYSRDQRLRLVATSWSDNWNKGFHLLKWMDNNLNWEEFDMTFIGRSPVNFENIRHVPPLTPVDLAGELKKHDVFVFCSRVESCSNALLEALHCGLPVLSVTGSSNDELVGGGGLVFDSVDEIQEKLEEIRSNYDRYRDQIRVMPLSDVGEAYLDFIGRAMHEQRLHNQGLLSANRWYPYFLVDYCVFSLRDKFRRLVRRRNWSAKLV